MRHAMNRIVPGLVCFALLASCSRVAFEELPPEPVAVETIPEPMPELPPPPPPPPPPPAMAEPTEAAMEAERRARAQAEARERARRRAEQRRAARPARPRAYMAAPGSPRASSGAVRGVEFPPASASAVPALPRGTGDETSPVINAGGPVTNAASDDPCAPGEPPELDLPRYEPWPPEQASSRIPLDDLIGPRGELTLYETGTVLRDALNQAGYQQHAFYAVPGGYIIVTETERTDPQGAGVTGTSRYLRPGEDRKGLLVSIRDLFLERPETYYRYLAIVVSDRLFCVSQDTLDIDEASRRVTGGFTDLSDDTRDIAFDDRFRVTALIYEFANDGIGYDLAMIAPGRIPARDHLERSGLAAAIPIAFEKARGARD